MMEMLEQVRLQLIAEDARSADGVIGGQCLAVENNQMINQEGLVDGPPIIIAQRP